MCMIAQGVGHQHEKRSYQTLQKSSEHALSKLCIADNADIKGELKTASCQFVETVVKNVIEKGALNKILNQNIDRLTRLKSFMDTFTSQKLASLRFTCLVAQFIKSAYEQNSGQVGLNG